MLFVVGWHLLCSSIAAAAAHFLRTTELRERDSAAVGDQELYRTYITSEMRNKMGELYPTPARKCKDRLVY